MSNSPNITMPSIGETEDDGMRINTSGTASDKAATPMARYTRCAAIREDILLSILFRFIKLRSLHGSGHRAIRKSVCAMGAMDCSTPARKCLRGKYLNQVALKQAYPE